jgi:uncharacterized protein YkwD
MNMTSFRSRFTLSLALALALLAPARAVAPQAAMDPQAGRPVIIQPKAEQLFSLANQSRAQAGVGRLEWDTALAAAAMQHCLRMVAEGQIAHRYGGEPDVTDRAGQAGAHFSLIEENVAVGSYVAMVHQGWLDSPGHRANLLNPLVDRVGIAVVFSGGVNYAVADYAQSVPVLTRTQVEATVGGLLRAKGFFLASDPTDARRYCSSGMKDLARPGFLMRWQNADVGQLPEPLLERIETGQYRTAAVGSCPPQNVEGLFTVYRVAVLLY